MFVLPPVSAIPELPKAERISVLDHLFEPCPTLADLLVDPVLSQRFLSYDELIEAARAELLAFLEKSEAEDLFDKVASIISAHPRLGPSKDKLSSHSSSEQKSLAGSEEEARKLQDLNSEYEQTFPGLRYVVFVNGRSREAVMSDMISRIQRRDIALERRAAFDAMCDIALDRASKLVSSL